MVQRRGYSSFIFQVNMQLRVECTCISANADGPCDAASRKIDDIALPSKYNYQATSVGR